MAERFQRAGEVVPGVFHWAAEAAPGGPEPVGWAVSAGERLVLVDPLRLPAGGLPAGFGRPGPIVLTCLERQREAFRLRRELQVDLFAPAGLEGLEEAPDLAYEAGDALPGGLSAFHAPGPQPHSQILWRTSGPRGVVFTSGLLVHDGAGRLRLAPSLSEPERARASVERMLAQLPVDVLCLLWGAPLAGDGDEALRALLRGLPEPASPLA